MVAHRPYTLGERIEQALADANAAGRTVTAIVVGAEDVSTFQELQAELAGDIGPTGKFGELRVKLDEDVFLSRLEFASVIGHPNAALL
ncbi:MAG: hypothetical protein ACYDD1_09665 [Caulobacteraceae bacterium]